MEWKVKLEWERVAESRYHLHTEDGNPLATIIFDRSQNTWHIRLLKKYDAIFLKTMFVNEAKEFAIDLLDQEDLTNAEWQEIDKTSYSLANLKGESLAVLDFDAEVQKWCAKILRREYKTILGTEIGLDQPEKVKKLTEDLIKAEQACHYRYVLNKFNEENKAQSTFQ